MKLDRIERLIYVWFSRLAGLLLVGMFTWRLAAGQGFWPWFIVLGIGIFYVLLAFVVEGHYRNEDQ